MSGRNDFESPSDLRILGSRRRIFGAPGFDLVSLDVTKAPNGALVYVESVRAYFQFLAHSSSTADGITIVNAAKSQGQWFRLPSDFAGASPWQNQLDWHINATTGSDENVGSSGAPLRSFAEFTRRVGQDLILNLTGTDQMVINVHTDLDEDLRILGLMVHGGAANRLLVTGVPLSPPLITGQVGVYTPSSVNVEGTLTDGSGVPIANWAVYVGYMVRLTSGASSGAFAFVSDIAVAGAGTARIGNFVRIDANGEPVLAAAPAPGDTFEILNIPFMRDVDLSAYHDTGVATGGAAVPALQIRWVRISPSGGQGLSNIRGGGMANPAHCNAIHFVGCNCNFSEMQAELGAGAKFSGCMTSGTFWGGYWGFEWEAGGTPTFDSGYLDSTGPADVNQGSYFQTGVSFFNCHSLRPLMFGVWDAIPGSPAILASRHSYVTLSQNWGNATGSYGISSQAYIDYPTGEQPTISGTTLGKDVIIGAVDHAYADLPWKNTLPNQAQWTGGAAAQGADTNDYMIIVQ